MQEKLKEAEQTIQDHNTETQKEIENYKQKILQQKERYNKKLQQLTEENEKHIAQLEKVKQLYEKTNLEKKELREKLDSLLATTTTTKSSKTEEIVEIVEEKKKEKVPEASENDDLKDQRITRTKTKNSKKRTRTPSPPESNKKMKKTTYILSFSSFDEEYKSKLSEMAKNLGAEINLSEDHDSTHVVCPPTSRTVKTLTALVNCRWVVTDEWIKESSKAKKFLSEYDYGIKVVERPFENKKFWISPPFKMEAKNEKKTQLLGHSP